MSPSRQAGLFLRLFLRLFLPLACLVVAGVWLYGKAEIQRELVRLQGQETLNVGLGAGALAGNLENISRDLIFLASHSALRATLEDPSSRNIAHLADDFVTFSRSKAIYDQLRWLDETGMERVRVDYAGGRPVIIGKEQLQNKGQRYFFTDSIKLNPGEVFVSPLDLNIEQNKIEVPFKPMVRVATPVTDSRGSKRGIVILNYYGQDMLRAYATATQAISDHAMVLNGEGYWLKSPNPDDEWGFMFKKTELSLAVRAPEIWAQLRSADSGQVFLSDGLWTWQTVYPLVAGQRSSTGAAEAFVPSRGEIETKQYVWKSVAHLSSAALEAVARPVQTKLFAVALGLLGFLGFGCWRIAAAEEEIWRINAGLERQVTERTRELHDKLAELDESNTELERRGEEMESMIYIASHDLRSPLVNIQGFGQRLDKAAAEISTRLAKDDVPETVRNDLAKLLDERVPGALGFIKQSSLRMDVLINGLLRLSRTGRAPLSIQPLEMNALMERIVGNLTFQAQQAGATVHVDTLPACMGDASQIDQVFTNLIDNAIKYRDPARPLEIRIRGSQEGKRCRYSVADNGMGIAADYQPRIWQLFHRLDPNGPVPGEGIGLTLVRRIVDRHRGSISLTSSPGEGSCFTIELPAVTSEDSRL